MDGGLCPSFMDLDYMNELLCWVERSEGSDYMWPVLEANSNNNDQEERLQRSSLPENLSSGFQYRTAISPWGQSRRCLVEGPGWCSITDRLVKAVEYINDFFRDKDVVLIQIWVPVSKGDRCVLTTRGQPFQVNKNCPQLAHYRDISVNFQFPAEEDSNESTGLPGRVFLAKLPEWTPDVQFFKKDEYPRVCHAQEYDVRGSLAVPVFDQSSLSCLGVIELVLTTQKINYLPQLQSVCKALEAVNLRGSILPNARNAKECDLSYQAVLCEIHDVFKSACETHRLPLAQTWVPCIQQGKEGCRHSDDNLIHCVSTVDSACYVADPHVRGFHEACSEHHLLKGQGLVGRAFVTNQACFSADLMSSSKAEYPLAHYAKMFGLQASVAIRLRSVSISSAEFVLEFFLPRNCISPEEHKRMLTSLSIIIQNVCQTLRVVTDQELQQETSGFMFSEEGLKPKRNLGVGAYEERLSGNSQHTDCHESRDSVSAFENGQSEVVLKKRCPRELRLQLNECVPGPDRASSACNSRGVGKRGDKKRLKTEKTITLQILQQYFAGSLKDAAKSIGVCPTTLKRICRQHGIKRWPSRKIKKVGHSLQKIQHVIDSVQGVSGGLQIESFYSSFPELVSPNSASNQFKNLKSPGGDSTSPRAAAPAAPVADSVTPSSSCSQSSSSSQCCSTGRQPKNSDTNAVLKRVKSAAELHYSSRNEEPKTLPRCQSHASLIQRPPSRFLPPTTKGGGDCRPREDVLRVKVSFGEEKIRLRVQNSWGYEDLLNEIARRFGMDESTGFQLKYLDDDSEWVLLTCDADLQECFDVCRSSLNQTIKLTFHRVPQQC
ncbi:PREDICTED: protein NLP4-like isoform X2 [Ipomoea nil]|uniref:protein NLP4-like isoform X2 n=1 Tax=Ipomoea nil TaxID=35883 RepID=UPI00090111BA|nr:PREDICTED: protein NLP4-like isoform X2 [Ipomoea nil]